MPNAAQPLSPRRPLAKKVTIRAPAVSRSPSSSVMAGSRLDRHPTPTRPFSLRHPVRIGASSKTKAWLTCAPERLQSSATSHKSSLKNTATSTDRLAETRCDKAGEPVFRSTRRARIGSGDCGAVLDPPQEQRLAHAFAGRHLASSAAPVSSTCTQWHNGSWPAAASFVRAYHSVKSASAAATLSG